MRDRRQQQYSDTIPQRRRVSLLNKLGIEGGGAMHVRLRAVVSLTLAAYAIGLGL